MVIIGLLFSFAGLLLLITQILKSKSFTGVTEATIVDFKKKQSTGPHYAVVLFPIYKYSVDGKDYVVVSGSGKSSWKLKIGDTVKLQYKPNNPNFIYVPDNKVPILISTAFILGGIIYTILYFFTH